MRGTVVRMWHRAVTLILCWVCHLGIGRTRLSDNKTVVECIVILNLGVSALPKDGDMSDDARDIEDTFRWNVQKRSLMQLRIAAIIVFIALLLSAPSLASAQSVPELAKKALAATVSLEMQDSNGDTLGHGSGFFVRPNLIVTNYHVIDGASRGYAKLVNTAIAYPINGFTAVDKTYDLALLKVSIPGVTPLPVGDSHVVQIGESVYVAGNPQGLEGTFSDGIISGRRDKGTKKERLQMTAPISPGSSGGPVLNRKGEVIGVSTSLYNPIFGVNLAFAVPSRALTALLRRPQKIKPLSSQTPSRVC